jgi:four helix bundle protein
MNKENLNARIKQFVVRIAKLIEQLPETKTSNTISGQIIRSATSIGANYRAACRSKSKRDFINKLKIVEEETDETIYWLELIEDCRQIKPERIKSLKSECNELLAIFVSSIKTARENL